MFERTKYQAGSLTKEPRMRQPDIWVFRWRETAPDGQRIRRKVTVGTVDEYRTESAAKKALAVLRIDTNPEPSKGSHPVLMTMGQLITHYRQHELGPVRYSKSASTVDGYKDYLRLWIEPRWGSIRPPAVKPVEVEGWLRSLSLADGTKAKVRAIMNAVFQHGLRHQLIQVNPIRGLVRQSAKRQKEPDVLTAAELRSILGPLPPMQKCLTFLAAATGLRFSELRGLQWQDMDGNTGVLNLRRGVVKSHITELKTKASRKPVPLDPAVVDALNAYRRLSPYNQPEDWIFASIKMKGSVPVWPSCLMADYIHPAAKAAGVTKHISWHTFRHSYATMLKGNGEDIKTVQESLRHANCSITLDTYTQAIPAAVRNAHSKIVEELARIA
jgi:integrase